MDLFNNIENGTPTGGQNYRINLVDPLSTDISFAFRCHTLSKEGEQRASQIGGVKWSG